MAEKIVSPGVFTKEIDASFLPAAIGNIGAVVIGPTVKGPTLVPTVVNSYGEFQQLFGDVFRSGSSYLQYLTSQTARNYLKHSGEITVLRIMGDGSLPAHAQISSSIDPAIMGGGEVATGSFTLANFNVGTTAGGISASIGATTFIITGSGAGAIGATTNTSTQIYVVSQSSLANMCNTFAATINHSASLHGLNISASSNGATKVGLTSSFNASNTLIPGEVHANITGGSFVSDTTYANTHYSMSKENSPFTATQLAGGSNYNNGTHSVSFNLYSLSDGEELNSGGTGSILTGAKNGFVSNSIGSDSILTHGTDNNVRWEIGNLNKNKGTFSLLIRKGNDTENDKQILETWNDVSLDPNASNYIAKVVGDQKITIAGTETEPYITYEGDYPNKSKYVRVSNISKTIDYLDENGNVRDGALSASLPSWHSGSNSGSEAGAFTGGYNGAVAHPLLSSLNESIGSTTQGIDLTNASNKSQYMKALNLLANQDEYDFNLMLLPGIIREAHANHTTIISKAIDVCESRGDAFVVVDTSLASENNIDNVTEQAEAMNSNYAATYWPWVQTPDEGTGKNVWVPPSVVMAGVYAFNDKVGAPWFAPAGLNRGTLDTVVQAKRKLTHGNRDDLYEKNVNPIATFPGQGVVVWGQKTLQKKASALDRVNVRRLLIKVKKFIAASSRFLVFEQNNAQTREKFLNIANPYLEQVQSQSGLNAFRVVMDETNNTPDVVDRNVLYGQLFLQPTKTAEFIVLDFTIQPTGAAFPE